MTRDGVRTFLPPDCLATIQPAITRLTRYSHYTVNCATPKGGVQAGTPPPFFVKDVILGQLHREIVQGCDLMGFKFTEHTGRIVKPFDFANLESHWDDTDINSVLDSAYAGQ
jgi:hypothetical protein